MTQPHGRGPVEAYEVLTLVVIGGLIAWWLLSWMGWMP